MGPRRTAAARQMQSTAAQQYCRALAQRRGDRVAVRPTASRLAGGGELSWVWWIDNVADGSAQAPPAIRQQFAHLRRVGIDGQTERQPQSAYTYMAANIAEMC